MRLIRLLVLLLLVIGSAHAVQAHAVVEGTEPADGAVLAEAPQEVVIHFSEPVSVIRVQVLDPAGLDVLAPEGVMSKNSALHLRLPAALAEGTYTASYRVVSLDGHPIASSLVFSVGRVTGGASAAREGPDPSAWRWSLVASWSVFYLALLGAAGGVLFTALVRPRAPSLGPIQQLVAQWAVLGLLAALAALAAQGGLLLGGSVGSLMEFGTWQAGARSSFGRAALCALAGLLLIRLSVSRQPSATVTLLALSGALLALGSFVLTGHVVTAGPRGLTWPLLLTHTALAGFWVGSLLPLHRVLRSPIEHAGPLVERFSRLAVLLVPVLLVAGGLIAVLQVRSAEALITTSYGRVLLLKLVLVAGLMGLAALNRLRLTPALVRGEAGAADRLSRSILAELGLVVAILAATAVLGITPPPRAVSSGQDLSEHDAQAHEEHGHGRAHVGRALHLMADSFQADLRLQPGRVGANTATITLRDPSGRLLEGLEVTVRLANPAQGIEPLARTAERQDQGVWQVRDLILGVAGDWEVELDVLVSDFMRDTAQAPLVLE